MSRAVGLVAVGAAILGSGVAATDGSPTAGEPNAAVATSTASSTVPGGEDAGPVDIGEGRTLYLECAGDGSPTILIEAGDESGVEDVAARVHVLGGRDPDVCLRSRRGRSQRRGCRCRGVDELLGDLEALLAAAELAGPYLLVGRVRRRVPDRRVRRAGTPTMLPDWCWWRRRRRSRFRACHP